MATPRKDPDSYSEELRLALANALSGRRGLVQCEDYQNAFYTQSLFYAYRQSLERSKDPHHRELAAAARRHVRTSITPRTRAFEDRSLTPLFDLRLVYIEPEEGNEDGRADTNADTDAASDANAA